MITVVHGPQGCGKTRNADRLKAQYRHKHFFDSWYGQKVPDNSLLLTHLEPPFKNPVNGRRIDLGSDVRVVAFAEAMAH